MAPKANRRKAAVERKLDAEMTDRAAFRFTFDPDDGPDSHVVALDVLAPALLDISALLQAANRAVNGDRAVARVSVSASPQEGSLDILLLVDVGLIEQVKDLLPALFGGALGVTAIAKAKPLLELIFGKKAVDEGLVGLVKKLRGKTIEEVKTLDKGRVEIRVQNNYFNLDAKVITLLNDPSTRLALQRLAQTAEKPGVESIRFSTPSDPDQPMTEDAEVIEREDVAAFDTPMDLAGYETAQQAVPASTRRAVLQLTKVWFREGRHKWQFSEGRGGGTYHAEILDQAFLDRVQSGAIAFAAGDALLVDLSTEQLRTKSGVLRAENRIERVIDILPAPRQMPIGS